MRIAILTLGSRGDVQPYLAIAKHAVAMGHEAVICTGKTFKAFIEAHHVEFREAESDLMAMLKTPEGQMVFNHAMKHPLRTKRFVSEVVNPAFRKTLEAFWETAQGADVILYHPKAFGAPDIGFKLNIPVISMPPVPMTYPIEEFPNLAISATGNFGKYLNKLTYRLIAKSESASIKEVNDFREKTLNLPRRKAGEYAFNLGDYEIPVIYPVSRHLFEDVKSWEGHVVLTGFPFLEQEGESLEESLETFIRAGKAPIVVSFSSMPLKDPSRFRSILENALEDSDERAIVLTGASGLAFHENERIMAVSGAPHMLLFPRAKGIVHHGGVGTVAAALKSGRPQQIIPFGVDQPFWAQRLYEKGLCLPPINEKTLNLASLTESFDKMSNQEIQKSAQAFMIKMAAEDGAQSALLEIERVVADFRQRA